MKILRISCLLLLCFLVPGFLKAEFLTLESIKGETLEVSLVRRQGKKFVIKRRKDGKEFTISLDALSKESRKQLLREAAALEKSFPPLEAAVSIGKRRKRDGNSSYMKVMEVTGKVTVTNLDNNRSCPPCLGNIIFIGQSQRNNKKFQILSNQKFKITPTRKGAVFNSSPFRTRYDSDNEDINIGGYKYAAYLLVLSDAEGKIIFTKTVYSKLRKSLDKIPGFAKKIRGRKKGASVIFH